MILNELDYFPKGMIKLDDYRGGHIYTSEEMKREFVEVLKESRQLNKKHNSIRGIEKLIEQDILVPTYNIKNVLGYIWTHYVYSGVKGHIYGTHFPKYNKIFIYLDNHLKTYKTYQKNLIAETVLHEIAHYYAKNDFPGFVRNYTKGLYNFYYSFIQILFHSDAAVPRKLLVEYIKIIYLIERSNKLTPEIIEKYKNSLVELGLALNVPEKEVKKTVNTVLSELYLYFAQTGTFITLSNRLLVPQALIGSYKVTFSVENVDTIAIQELFSVSEVAAIMVGIGVYNNILKYLETIK